MHRRRQAGNGTTHPTRDQAAADAVENTRIHAYLGASALMRALCGAVEDAARRADALHRLELALRVIP